MAGSLAGVCLFKDQKGWAINQTVAPYRHWKSTSTDPATFSIEHSNATQSTLHRYALKALRNYVEGDNSQIGVVKVANMSYASQWTQPDGRSIIACANYNPKDKESKLWASIRDEYSGNMETLPNISSAKVTFDDSSILILYMLIRADISEQKGYTDGAITYDLLAKAKASYAANGFIDETIARLVCDDLYFSLTGGEINVNIRNGIVSDLKRERIDNNEFLSGTIICGNPDILTTKYANAKSDLVTMAEAKDMVKEYTSTLHWTDDEERMIPEFPDDAEVPERVVTMARRFVESLDWETPLCNPGWRGTTGLGKSYGVKMLACILHTPLVWMTCASTTELEDFLSKHVPNTDNTANADIRLANNLPTFDDISYDPAYAYKMLTGIDKEDATSEDALEAYGKACAASSSSNKNQFKIVNSDFVTALVNGYIVEVQEFSRIRDSGTLVGLNNFCEPDAVIPLVDGRHVKRHKHAMVVWTDNVGYASCRKVDGSVLSRISYIFSDEELEKEVIQRRMRANTNASFDLIDKMIDVWRVIQRFCKERDITDEGTCSMRELQNWIQLTVLDGTSKIAETCKEAIISKLSSDPDTQDEIMDECVRLELATSFAGLNANP